MNVVECPLQENELRLVRSGCRELEYSLLKGPVLLDNYSCEFNYFLSSQIYRLDPSIYGEGWCLSGTSEMAIAQYVMNRNFEKEELPKLYAAVSRCYRAEVSSCATEKGIYR